jgi:hypothetical protein
VQGEAKQSGKKAGVLQAHEYPNLFHVSVAGFIYATDKE